MTASPEAFVHHLNDARYRTQTEGHYQGVAPWVHTHLNCRAHEGSPRNAPHSSCILMAQGAGGSLPDQHSVLLAPCATGPCARI